MTRLWFARASHTPVAVVVVAAIAFAVRAPRVFAKQSLGFDDGVFLSSVHAMRLGFEPFKEIFSSQGPLFLPVLRLFDLVGGERYWAPRLAMALTGAALAGLSAATIARWKGRPAVWATGLAVGFSGSAFSASSALSADGVAAVFAVAAFYVVSGRTFTERHVLAAGLFLGVGVSIKSLFIVPAVLAVAWVLWRRSGLTDLGLAGAVGLLVTLVSFLWWGAPEVWNQYVAFHLDAAANRHPLRNLLAIGGRAFIHERPAIILGLPALVLGIRMTRGSPNPQGSGVMGGKVNRILVQALGIWTASTMLVLILHSPLFPRHSVFVLIPAVLLVAMTTHTGHWVLAAVLASVALQLLTLDWIPAPDPVEEEAIAVLLRLPPETTIVTDEPGLAYFAGLSVPPSLVEPSFKRIETEYLTRSEVESVLNAPSTCAVLFWSGRFDLLGLNPSALEGYEVVERFGPSRVLAERIDCP